MRLALSVLLVGLLATCPIVCGTAHALSGGDGCEHHANGKTPAPVNDDCCVCNGALAPSLEAASYTCGLDLSAGPWLLEIPRGLIGLMTATDYDAATLALVASPGDCGPLNYGSARLPHFRC